jgi:hypothetical protein
LHRIAAWFSGSTSRDEIAGVDQDSEFLISTSRKSKDTGLILERKSAEWPEKHAMSAIVLAVRSIFRTTGAADIVLSVTNASCSRARVIFRKV